MRTIPRATEDDDSSLKVRKRKKIFKIQKLTPNGHPKQYSFYRFLFLSETTTHTKTHVRARERRRKNVGNRSRS